MIFIIIIIIIILLILLYVYYITTNQLPRIILVAFGDSVKFGDSIQQLKDEANKMGIFSEIILYTESDLPRLCEKEHYDFIKSHSRGYGYWLWKPLILLDVMNTISKPGDVIMYTDAGTSLNKQGLPRMKEYIKMVTKTSDGILAPCNLKHKEKIWTKEDVLTELKCDEKCRESGQIASGTLLLCHSDKNIEFIREWFRAMIKNNYTLVDDTPSIKPNDLEFKEHRHDQSLLSILLKTTRPDAIVLP